MVQGALYSKKAPSTALGWRGSKLNRRFVTPKFARGPVFHFPRPQFLGNYETEKIPQQKLAQRAVAIKRPWLGCKIHGRILKFKIGLLVRLKQLVGLFWLFCLAFWQFFRPFCKLYYCSRVAMRAFVSCFYYFLFREYNSDEIRWDGLGPYCPQGLWARMVPKSDQN